MAPFALFTNRGRAAGRLPGKGAGVKRDLDSHSIAKVVGVFWFSFLQHDELPATLLRDNPADRALSNVATGPSFLLPFGAANRPDHASLPLVAT